MCFVSAAYSLLAAHGCSEEACLSEKHAEPLSKLNSFLSSSCHHEGGNFIFSLSLPPLHSHHLRTKPLTHSPAFDLGPLRSRMRKLCSLVPLGHPSPLFGQQLTPGEGYLEISCFLPLTDGQGEQTGVQQNEWPMESRRQLTAVQC